MEPSDKETRAIFLNFKEVRSLEKNIQALDLGKAYNISLINLDQKVIKVKYKRLKEKASRIKSHLQPEEVEEFKKMEEDGKLNIIIPSSDLQLKIKAAERRLKLMPRAKSAAPRLQLNGIGKENKSNQYNTPRSGRKLRIHTSTPQPKTPRSPQTPKEIDLDRPVSARISKPVKGYGDYLVPKSVREDRRQSIDIRCMNDDLKAFKEQNIPTVNVVYEEAESSENNSLSDTSRTQAEREIHRVSNVNASPITAAKTDGNKIITTNGENNLKDSQTPVTDKENPDSVITIAVPTFPIANVGTNAEAHKIKKASDSKDISYNISVSNELEKTNTSVIKDRPISGNSTRNTASLLQVPSSTVKALNKNENKKVVSSSKSKIRPMSVPATQKTEFNKTPQKTRPKTAIEMAVETRKKSVMDIRRASSMLKEGKTRSPFSCHEQEINEKKGKPFRSIREGANTANNDGEIFDDTLGDDLHKEMKKGMILGEVATSLYLEDKIDHFFENVDKYVKENPNYVYDPEAAKAKKVPRVDKDKKTRPKRNVLRRRQLERQLHEATIEEMKKSRWLRRDDNDLDTSGVNTLVVDQMKMLNKLRHPYDEDYYK